MVSGDTAKRVRDFMVGYLLPHQQGFYRTYLSGAGEGEEEHALHRIARYLLSHKCERVTLRDLKRATHLGDQEIERTMYADHGAQRLAAYHWVGAPQSPRRASPEWPGNPPI